jgi:tRNA nucleotidyltransferase (CCA-adding enzyme)
LGGKDLKRLGFKPGKLYKDILNALLEARLNDLVSTKRDEEKFVKEHFGKYLEG